MSRVRIGEFVTLQRGQSYKSRLLGESGPFLLGLGTIERNGGFRGDSLKRYSGGTPERIMLRPDDLYVSLKDVTHSADLLGAVARVPHSIHAGRLTQDTIRIDVDDAKINSEYLYWLLQSPQYRRYCKAHGTGTTNLDLSQNDFLGFTFDLPNRTRQKSIADLLGALDDKIAANSRLAHTADELQRTKFQSLLANAVQVPLSETAQFVNGRAFTKNATGSGRLVVRIAELNSGPGASTVYNDVEVEEKHLARSGDILFAWSGSLTLHRWSRDEAIVNQHIFKVIPNRGYPSWLVFELIRHKLKDFRAVAADKATTMGHIQRRHLDEPVLVPLQAAIASCDSLMAGLWDRALKANEENLALASLRDTLLPQLMSGKLRVKDAEKVVEAVV